MFSNYGVRMGNEGDIIIMACGLFVLCVEEIFNEM